MNLSKTGLVCRHSLQNKTRKLYSLPARRVVDGPFKNLYKTTAFWE